jgi:SulP family sulfate permease
MLIYRTARPHIAILGRLPNTRDYRNIERFDKIDTRKDVLVLRHDAQLYFANATYFTDRVKEAADNKSGTLKLIVLHCGSISTIDMTALEELKELVSELNKSGVTFYFSGLIGPVRDFLHATRFIEEHGRHKFHLDVQGAIDAYDAGSDEHDTPYFKQATQTNLFREKPI